jgi:sterol desaturase/sphingolipid hydroxylase (fatty acid hydroxylase superfamily)
MFRTVLRCSYAPFMLLAGNGLALLGVAHGLPLMGLLPWLILAILVSFVVERQVPYDTAAVHPSELRRDLAHAIANETLGMAGVAAIPLLSGLSPWSAAWPHHWPLVAQWLLAIIVADAGLTLMHWASHHVRWLWRLHAVHHSVERLYGLNGLMKHPLHQLVETAAGVTPLLAIGMPRDVGALLAYSVALQLLLQHSNVDMRLGPLRHLLAVAPLHRFHHQRWAGIGDVNFGLFTTWWDRFLGTAVDDPARRFKPGDFGIGTQPDYPRGYLDQLREPFRTPAKP